MFNKISFGKRIKELRTTKNLKQSDLAGLLGVSITQISDIENGKRTTSIEKLIILADYFNVSIDYLVGRTDRKLFKKFD